MSTMHPSEKELSLAPRAASDEDEALDEGANGTGALNRAKRQIPEPPLLNGHGPAKVVALCNQKGGVGKTTSTINLGAALTEFGRRVLIVDFDPQGALSVGLGMPAHMLEKTIYNVIIERSITITDAIIRTSVDNLDLPPTDSVNAPPSKASRRKISSPAYMLPNNRMPCETVLDTNSTSCIATLAIESRTKAIQVSGLIVKIGRAHV